MSMSSNMTVKISTGYAQYAYMDHVNWGTVVNSTDVLNFEI